jgi:hypothetical protein
MHWIASGMLETGVANPERMIEGTRKRNAPVNGGDKLCQMAA